MTDKIPCKQCGGLTLPETAERFEGICAFCFKKNQPPPEPPQLSPEEKRLHRKWDRLVHRIPSMSVKTLLKQKCPFCQSGLQIGYSPDVMRTGSLGVHCAGFPDCTAVTHLDGLSHVPKWTDELPHQIITDGNGNYVENTPEVANKRLEDIVARRAKSST